MSIQGDLKSLSLGAIFQVLDGERKSGLLTINSGSIQRRVFIHSGMVVFLTSDDPRDFLGHFLVSHGVIDEETLANTFRAKENNPGLIGQVLVKMNELTEPDLKQQLIRKMEESVYQIFLIESGKFFFEDEEECGTHLPIFAELPIRRLLFEGLKRIDEFKNFKTHFPESLQTFLVHREKINDQTNLTRDAQKVLDLLEQGISIDELCLQFHCYEYTILKILDFLAKGGLIEKSELKISAEIQPKENNLPPSDQLLELAVKAEQESQFDVALEIYADLLKLDPNNDRARENLHALEKKISSDLTKKILPKRAIPILKDAASLSGKAFSPQDGFVLSRINGTWNISEILTVIPLPEPQVLLILKRFLDEKIISLRV